MSPISNIANSALQAFGTSQQVTAHNLANVNTDSFTASRTVFQEAAPGGVTASVLAGGDSVDISREAIQMISDTRNSAASIKALKTADDMVRELINIKA